MMIIETWRYDYVAFVLYKALNTFCFAAVVYQLPWIGVELKAIPITFAIVSAILALHSHFNIILMEGGVGRNGSTVAVSGSVIVSGGREWEKQPSSGLLATNSVEYKFKWSVQIVVQAAQEMLVIATLAV